MQRWMIAVVLVPAVLLIIILVARIKRSCGEVVSPASGRTLIEFDIRQDIELSLLTAFAEPAQFAIWLEEPVSHRLQTVFVTYRSGSGDWLGTADRPSSLPRWFEVFQEETNSPGLPSLDNPAPIAVTGATPQEEHFTTSVEVKPGSRWLCWIEVNLSGDFNSDYQQYDEKAKTSDEDFCGQPALIYRGEITAIPGIQIVPELYGQSVLNSPDGKTVQPVSNGVTTAKGIFKSIKIRVIKKADVSNTKDNSSAASV